ncbi:uncharacterized protein LOC141718937 [Apium graveolens]|uniref:uncharacterized protein LOC141718937 n=1 Tax=Apium graveolens TaxID=4045 RepID=UPI003D7BDC96
MARGRGRGQGENLGGNQGRNPEVIVIPEDAQNTNQQQAPPGGDQEVVPPPHAQGPQPHMQTIPGMGTFNVDDLKRLLNHLEGRVTTTDKIPSPLSMVVREAQLPAGYRNTTSDLRFHGSSDPVEFLGRFNIEMDVYQVPDLARCRLLVETFRESAHQLFQKLEPGGITSWDQTKTLFLTKFQAAVRYAPSITTLANVKQRENESLTSYFKRFNAESTSVRGASDEALKSFLIAGLRVGSDLWKHLQGKDPATLADVFALAESFKAIEQSLSEDKGRRRSCPSGSNNETLEDNKFFRDGSIRAIYGGDPGMECSNRALSRYAREARFRPLTDIHRVETRSPKVFKGESMDITFREADARWVHHPHNDALVISIHIGTKNVHRAFIDNGSSANILYYITFKKMGLPDRDMSGEDSWVYGFSGEGVRVMGSIRLSCTLGESPLSVIKMLDFKVLNQESSHIMLLG